MTHILVTNDDGVDSPGLLALKQALEPHGRVSVIAPTATAADSFSTAFSLMDTPAVRLACERHSELTVDMISALGAHERFGRAA